MKWELKGLEVGRAPGTHEPFGVGLLAGGGGGSGRRRVGTVANFTLTGRRGEDWAAGIEP